MNKTRRILVDLVSAGWQLRFMLTCDADTRVVAGQRFEIASLGRESVIGTPINGTITNRTDGLTLIRMLAEERDKIVNLRRLRALSGVSDIQSVK